MMVCNDNIFTCTKCLLYYPASIGSLDFSFPNLSSHRSNPTWTIKDVIMRAFIFTMKMCILPLRTCPVHYLEMLMKLHRDSVV